MPAKYVAATGRPAFDLAGDSLTIPEAAVACGVSSEVIRNAIKSGALRATMPAGYTPQRTGRGVGYRIRKADLQAWFLPEPKEA